MNRHLAVANVELGAVAVHLDLMDPVVPLGRPGPFGGMAPGDEARVCGRSRSLAVAVSRNATVPGLRDRAMRALTGSKAIR